MLMKMFKELKLKNQLKHVNDALMGQMNIICLKTKINSDAQTVEEYLMRMN